MKTGPILISVQTPREDRLWRIKRIGNFLAAGIVLTLRNGSGVNITVQTYGRHSFPMYDLVGKLKPEDDYSNRDIDTDTD